MREKPFELMCRMETGEKFGSETVARWYMARAMVRARLQDVAFGPATDGHLHVVVDGDGPRMLSVARQVALSAHYINFHEDVDGLAPHNRTVITIVSSRPDIKAELQREEYLCNLPKYCKYVGRNLMVENEDSYIDIEIHIADACPENGGTGPMVVFRQEEVDAFFDKAMDDEATLSVDTSMAEYVARVYRLGAVIDNLPAEDIHCASRYALALDVFMYDRLKEPQKLMFVGADCDNATWVRELLSNVFCADCFESRRRSVMLCGDVDDQAVWQGCNEALSRSEHARWVAEKLVMGYSPLDARQRYRDESLSYDKKKRIQYRNALKRDARHPAHIDLCSYADLRRINPDDMKYDSFLMLAIPAILKTSDKR
ncbi:MAG: hypothetical protein IJ637_07110 [Prevotella sp.]|nr:hypothetical protein [Prevotella sp.]